MKIIHDPQVNGAQMQKVCNVMTECQNVTWKHKRAAMKELFLMVSLLPINVVPAVQIEKNILIVTSLVLL